MGQEEEDDGGWEGDKRAGGIKEDKVSSTQSPFLSSQINDLVFPNEAFTVKNTTVTNAQRSSENPIKMDANNSLFYLGCSRHTTFLLYHPQEIPQAPATSSFVT